MMLYLNGFAWPYKTVVVAIAALLDIAAISWGITFVVRIIDPDKYTNAAKRLIAEEEQAIPRAGKQEASEDFFALFEQLEMAMRNTLEQAGLSAPLTSERSRREGPFRLLLIALYQNGLIDRNLFNDIMQIGRYRNLAQYGRVRNVDEAIINQTRTVPARIQALSLSSNIASSFLHPVICAPAGHELVKIIQNSIHGFFRNLK